MKEEHKRQYTFWNSNPGLVSPRVKKILSIPKLSRLLSRFIIKSRNKN